MKKMIKSEYRMFFVLIFVFAILAIGEVSAQTFQTSSQSFTGVSSSSSFINNYNYQQSFQSYYGGESWYKLTWPDLNDKQVCESRQDVMLKIPNAGCRPVVVRSDLLAEQNVPVFCQIEAIKINPLIDVTKVRRMNFISDFNSKYIAGVDYHPARVALQTKNVIVGSPIVNNIGYVVVVLRKNENESSLPDFVSVNLSASIDYETGNVFGIGRAGFYLTPQNDAEWEKEKLKQSFWNGRYFLRLVNVEPNFADLAIYQGDRRVATSRVETGKPSKMYVPGSYCRAGLTMYFDGFQQAKDKARLEIGDGNGGFDTVEVYQGSKIINGQCLVENVLINNNTSVETGKVIISCPSERSLILQLSERFASFGGNTPRFDNETNITYIEFKSLNGTRYGTDKNNELVFYNKTGKWEKIYPDYKGAKKIGELEKLKADLIEYTQTFAKDSEVKEELIEAGSEEERVFNRAIAGYESIADDYTNEKQQDINTSAYYGEAALQAAIKLAQEYGKGKIEARLINKILKLYPGTQNEYFYKARLQELASLDSSNSGVSVYLLNKYRTIRLVSLSRPEKAASAKLYIGERAFGIKLNERKPLPFFGNSSNGDIELAEVKPDYVILNQYCPSKTSNRALEKKESVVLKSSDIIGKELCNGLNVKLESLDMQEVASIRLEPIAEGVNNKVNLSVVVGIEKRAIQLSPDKTKEMIENLNKSIKKWENIVESLGKVVSGLKASCFATTAVLTVKNFVSGLSGEGIARQQVMRGDNGWTIKCKQMVDRGEASTLNECYRRNAGAISKDVNAYTQTINQVNKNIKDREALNKGTGGFLNDQTVNRDESVKSYAKYLYDNYGDRQVGAGKVKDILGKEGGGFNEDGYKNGEYSYEQLRELETGLIMQDKSERGEASPTMFANSNNSLGRIGDQIATSQRWIKQSNENKKSGKIGVAATDITMKGRSNVNAEVTPLSEAPNANLKDDVVNVLKQGNGPTQDVKYATYFNVPAGAKLEPGLYAVGLEKGSGDVYGIRTMARVNNDGTLNASVDKPKINEFLRDSSISSVNAKEYTSYNNQHIRPQVRYHETEPYKGMPALAPFDLQHGWYAATKQTLPAFGGSKAYFDSGRVSTFWLCNVGKNGVEQFEEGLGDDKCLEVNYDGGQAVLFPGLDETQTKALIERGRKALMDAANQYGNKIVRIGSITISDVKAAAAIPNMQCQDFMDPEDCYILFNVCDPVICPATRCNLGGAYQVADVIQSGIIGSTVLCLPNIREKIYIPVCLSGIQAGLDSYVSILKSFRDCLQESLTSGRNVGICDQVTSIYLCEFFWRQLAPLANVIIPKMIEYAYGDRTAARGGGEYLSVQGAWKNMQNSIDYFKNVYAVNSMKAFQIRSIEEAGTPFCKAFISAKAPTQFKSLIEPDSPPQFNGWFSAIRQTDATITPIDQYKVFYHIYAGKDSGASYRVYLKTPTESAYYHSSSEWLVATGFIPRGEYETQTKDFNAPTGYQELCISLDGNEECGFKQVSSSFAVNYVRDKYVSDEMARTDITSEKECTSGGVNAGSLLANTNPQAAVEEAILPQDYYRGIVRICATDNPGKSTNPARFVNVGNCGDPKLICWLDKKSVDNAITAGDIGVRNATLSEIEKRQIEMLNASGEIIDINLAETEIESLEEQEKTLVINAMPATKGSDIAAYGTATAIIKKIDEELMPKLYMSNHKARVLIVKARVIEKIFRAYPRKSNASAGSAGNAAATTTPNQTAVASPSAAAASIVKFTLSASNYSQSSIIKIMSQDGANTGISISNGNVFYGGNKVGDIEQQPDKITYKINLDQNKAKSIPYDFSDLNGATFSDNKKDSKGNLVLAKENSQQAQQVQTASGSDSLGQAESIR